MTGLANHADTSSLKLVAHCIGQPTTDRLMNEFNNCTAYCVPTIIDDGVQGGSVSHGLMLQHAVSMLDDGDIHLIADTDTVVLARGWDDYLRIQLLDKRIGVVGATFEDIGGFSSGSEPGQMFKKIPYTAFMALSPLHRWRDLDLTSQKNEANIPITDPTMSLIYNLPVGFTVLRDVGFRIPPYLHDHGINYTGWEQLKGSKTALVLKGLNDYHEEYHVENGVPFVIHQRGSLRHPFREGMSTAFYAAADAWLTRVKNHGPTWEWTPNADNASVLEHVASIKQAEAPRIAEIVRTASVRPYSPETLAGWVKITADDAGIFSRHTQPVPNCIAVPTHRKHVRVEGTVSGLSLLAPNCGSTAYSMTIRNMTPAPVTIKVAELPRAVTVPDGKCWLVLIDVDGAVHVE